ncbi:alpha/beta hydrolase [Actinomadura graeca]|uniref:Alpha/beta hydrolase n=1 Tax=Actinomadura graeca TaxID=2750812 RepID=A0ABX8QRI9_9ACTN|nr:alpha/beta hydrolase [Actinomadura graeca]QXJ21426.1 alpha/beta hydrolase [Actinomadura graeca]
MIGQVGADPAVPVDPTVRAILALAQGPGEGGFDPERARAGLRALTVTARSPASVASVRAVEPLSVEGMDARVYRPESQGPVPTVVYFHGGGFVLGDLDTHDNHCRWLCRETGAAVVSVAYRRAPEWPFPAAVDDAVRAVAWAARNVDALGGLPGPPAVAGDSAGANLATVTAQVGAGGGGPRPSAQLLTYPVTDMREDAGYPSRRTYGTGHLLTADAMRWFRSCYRPGAASPLASPILGRLAGLPPAVVVTMGHDPLRDEGEAYAAALAGAGVPVVRHRFDALVHGSFELPVLSPACAEAMRTAFGSFRGLLTRSGSEAR